MKIYVANVKSVEGRAVLVESDMVPLTKNPVQPALDGIIKMTPPEVDDQVLVFDLDSSNAVRWFVPINLEFDNANPSFIQIGDATEPVLLGDSFVDAIEQLIDAMVLETHLGFASIPTSPPVNSASYTAVKALLQAAKSQKVKAE